MMTTENKIKSKDILLLMKECERKHPDLLMVEFVEMYLNGKKKKGKTK